MSDIEATPFNTRQTQNRCVLGPHEPEGEHTPQRHITRRSFVGAAATTVAVASLSQMLPSLALAEEALVPHEPSDNNGDTPSVPEDSVETSAPAEEAPSLSDSPADPTDPTDPTTEQPSSTPVDETTDEEANGEADETSVDEEPDKQTETEDGLAPLDAERLVPEGIYLIRSSLAHTQVLDIAAGSRQSQANVQLYNSNMTGAQSFALSYDEDGYATFINTQSGNALDVTWGEKRSGANVWQYTPNNTTAQKWVIESADTDNGYVIRSALSENLVLDVTGAQTANGTNIQIYTRNGTRAQTFFFIDLASIYTPESSVALAAGDYVISSTLSGSPVLDIPGAGHASGLQLQLYTPNRTFAQVFRVSFDGTYYTLQSITSGKTLTVAGNNRVATTAAIQENHNPALLSQKWALEDNGDGSVTFISASCGLALDAAGGQNTNGTRLQLYTPNGTLAQRFRITAAPAAILADNTIISLIPYSALDTRIDIAAASRQSGATAQIYVSNRTLAQKFLAVDRGDNIFTFAALCSGQLLAVENNRPCQRPLASSGPLAAQLWKVERSLGGMTLTNQESGQRLALSDSSLMTAPPASSTSQCFNYATVSAIEPGIYVFTTKDGFALDISGGSINNGANVQIYTPNNTNAQKFKVETAANGTISIRNCRSEKAVTVEGSSTAHGTNVLQQTYQTGANQRFTLVPAGDGYLHMRSALSPTTYLGADRSASGANVYSTTDIARALSFSYRETTYIKADKWIAITFDDGPSAYTENLLNELKKRDVHATFFIVGSFAQSTGNQALLRRMSNEGHEIGNHTWAHDGSPNVLMGSLQATDDLVQKITGKPTALMRPPGGNLNDKIRSCGKPIILWSIDPRDWENRNGSYIYSHVVNNAQSGDIVLLHDSHNTTIPAALRIIDTLKERGYAFVTVSQLLGSPKPNTIYRSGPTTVGTF